ncbi:hypothetical protein KL911_000608 [Ogataea haglerorum]|uniref:uncharacterized protein n=1 Tax=Ogataea haglerorum TaxID=1937702 RepID=UPI001C88F01E|nr:uncharacterized protein KL911_000608 [Ogataea haglerorum]KAG7757632.1 hypothetical protein KL911_000608 [Ogataea haglerorum]
MSAQNKSPGLQLIGSKGTVDPPIANGMGLLSVKTPRGMESPRILEGGSPDTHVRPGLNRPPSIQKITDAAHKMSDYFSTSMANLHSSHNMSESPTYSRTSSNSSLGKLLESFHHHKPNATTRKSTSSIATSPSRDNLGILARARRSSAKLDEYDRQTHEESAPPLSQLPKVKETHYVRVEYDPITHKRILNTYEILKDLGSGQHGKVKLAKDLNSNELVAIKIVDRGSKPRLGRLTRPGSSQEDKIRREIAIMKKCSHPHVVKLLEVLDAESSRKIYMVLEYLEKGEIQWQKEDEETGFKPEPLLSLSEAKNVFRDVVSGLEYLHNQGIIHRDIKPSNLLVSKDYVVKISDFGVSFAASLEGNDEVELAKTAGTPAFLAPELCKTDGSFDKVTYKIDIWALGVTLYCLLFGCLPFNAESEFALFDTICNKPLTYPDTNKWKCSPPIPDYDLNQAKDLINKLLQKSPEHRIDISDIKAHPFFLEGLSRAQSRKYNANWNSKMKIAVSNEEVNEAVVGIGNRIKKKLSDVFRLTGLSVPKTKQSLYLQSLKGMMSPSDSESSTGTPTNGEHSYLLSEALSTSGWSKGSSLPPSPSAQSATPPKLVSRRNELAPGNRDSLALSIDSSTTDSSSLSKAVATKHNVDADSLIAPNRRGSSALSQLSEIIRTTSNPDSSNMPMTESEMTITTDTSERELIAPSDRVDDKSGHTNITEEQESLNRASLPVVPSFASLDSFYENSSNPNTSSLETSVYAGIPSQRLPTNLDTRHGSVSSSMSISRASQGERRFAPSHALGNDVPLHTMNSAVSVPEHIKSDLESMAPAISNDYYSARHVPSAGRLANIAVPQRRNSRKVVFNNGSENCASSDDEGSSEQRTIKVSGNPQETQKSPNSAARNPLYGKKLVIAPATHDSDCESDSEDSDESIELTLSFGKNRSRPPLVARPSLPRAASHATSIIQDSIHDVPLNLISPDYQTEASKLIPGIGNTDLSGK